MEIIGPILISTIAGLSTVLGGLIIFLKIKEINIPKFITFCLSFSLAVMICISITDLIPDSSRIILTEYGLFKGLIICIITFIIGVIIIVLVNKKINKHKTFEANEKSLYRVGLLSMIALMIHNLPEGIATFLASYKDISLGISLAMAIMMHNIPEGISIAVPIYYSTKKKSKALKMTFLSGLAEPLGAILAFIFLSKFITDGLISIVLIFVAGIMITLSINELLPQAIKYKQDKYIYLGLFSGTFIMILNNMFF